MLNLATLTEQKIIEYCHQRDAIRPYSFEKHPGLT